MTAAADIRVTPNPPRDEIPATATRRPRVRGAIDATDVGRVLSNGGQWPHKDAFYGLLPCLLSKTVFCSRDELQVVQKYIYSTLQWTHSPFSNFLPSDLKSETQLPPWKLITKFGNGPDSFGMYWLSLKSSFWNESIFHENASALLKWTLMARSVSEMLCWFRTKPVLSIHFCSLF